MPLYFAYGSNMEEAVLRTRCPKARALGRARLPRHRFVVMRNGFASVCRDPVTDVHGVLFDLALSDIPPLDRYEELDQGLYTKAVQPVVRAKGMPVQAILYIGTDTGGGPASPAYMPGVVVSAKAVGLPAAYVAMLESLVTRPQSGPAHLRSRLVP